MTTSDNVWTAWIRVQPASWAGLCYFGTLAVVFVVGLYRVLRVLYLYLWKPVRMNESLDGPGARKSWRITSIGLTASAVLASGLAFLTFQLIVNGSAEIIHIDNLELTKNAAGNAVLALSGIGLTIAACGIFARPVFQGAGWWTGLLGATLAVLFLPLGLLTFPSGLAAWVSLTDAAVRRAFVAG